MTPGCSGPSSPRYIWGHDQLAHPNAAPKRGTAASPTVKSRSTSILRGFTVQAVASLVGAEGSPVTSSTNNKRTKLLPEEAGGLWELNWTSIQVGWCP
jgi:hypothetical protein